MAAGADNATEEQANAAKAAQVAAPGVKKSTLGIAVSAILLASWIAWLLYLAIRLNF